MMQRLLTCAALLALGAVPADAQVAGSPSPSPITVVPAAPPPPDQAAINAKSEASGDQVVGFMKVARGRMKAARFSGEVGIAFAYRDYPHKKRADEFTPNSVLMAQDAEGNVRKAGEPWRWASVTKQVIAVLVMQEAARGTIDLDQPVARYLPAFTSPNAPRITVRQLLRHQTGLPNPDDTPANADGVPAFYAPGYEGSRDPLTGYCAGPVKGEAGGAWTYNNCDYMVAGALLEAVTGKSWQDLVRQRLNIPFEKLGQWYPPSKLIGMGNITATPPASEVWPGTVAGQREPVVDLASYGAAGGLSGPVNELLWFDIYLAAGQLLPPETLAELWDGQPELGYLALGQWAFEAQLTGCSAPVRIIERRGAIGGVQVRNFILPETEMALAMFTDQAEFDFGEIWQSAGFSYEMLSLAACPQGTP
jgi:CubicO group peptidase (beta-lactamase class C family)